MAVVQDSHACAHLRARLVVTVPSKPKRIKRDSSFEG